MSPPCYAIYHQIGDIARLKAFLYLLLPSEKEREKMEGKVRVVCKDSGRFDSNTFLILSILAYCRI